ncbi:NK-tumor recognition protein isoform X1 [Pygocentrus nattereri]|uniref:NK-tumor recognition protein isoform X1 n=2 Tax=Pygocentrus nattereri TaxID=42514 RepID=UPI0018913407|nr:NK-tumor recognition protein isoform X1 [Pygocentrus nattereri]
MGVKDRPQCYFDVEINREPVGRIVFKLFSDVCPKTSKNFLCLCTGEKDTGKTTGKKLCYKGSTFHRVVKNFMIQGGDFTEGNGRGGESIYGGYFEDENFILKHDRAFLLSMANRGKDTNGSQFFITTKPAPHLDGVHVVFGLVISGFEVIKRIEGLKTDSASRPYADVRVIDCGQLITKSANDVLERKKRKVFHSEDDSPSSSESHYSSFESGEESDEKYTRRKKKTSSKSKHSKRRRKDVEKTEKQHEKMTVQKCPAEREMAEEEDGEKEQNVKREKPVVRPEEIPPVPENRFLLRRDVPVQEETTDLTEQETATAPSDPKPAVTKSGRKLKGRGTMRYHTPPRSKSRSESEEERGSSETPPHWKEEMQRTKTYQPPSVEKWSKGEKWDDRSDTPWSRSRSRERSSGQSSDRSIQHHRHKKEKKKAKRKKKAKKRKHSKKHKKNKFKEASLSEGERSMSSSRRSRLSSHSERRSYSHSRSPSTSRHSCRTYRSGSNRRRFSSRSSRDTQSYSCSRGRSYSRSRSRSESRFRSSSRSRSRSQSGRSITRSRSHSRSMSGYRTRSRSRSRSRYRTPSPHYRKKSRSPKRAKLNEGSTQKINKTLPTTTQTVESKAPPATSSEGAPVLPLSDSPPPSRWKPGQKPWKPSYVRIQEIKAKTDSTYLESRTPGVDLEREPLSTFQSQVEDPNSARQHGANNKQPDSLLHRRSSRSQSSSRSRSTSHSRYQSTSPGQYNHRSSSSSSSSRRSNSHDSYRKRSSEKRGKRHHRSHRKSRKRAKNVVRSHAKKGASLSHSDDDTEAMHSPINQQNSSEVQENALDPVSDHGSKTDRAKNLNVDKTSHVVLKKSKTGSGWESDGDNLSKLSSVDVQNATQICSKMEGGLSEMQKKMILAQCWESESDSEMPESKTMVSETKHVSDKEEGEASSESESEAPAGLCNKPNQVSRVSEEFKSIEEHSDDYTKAEKHKSKKAKRKHKHKRRNSDRPGSHRLKTKTKKSKKKHQKPKETFHWQPPLEFGEEGEEDDSLAQVKHRDLRQEGTDNEEPTRSVKVMQMKSQDFKNKDHEKVTEDSSKEHCLAVEAPYSMNMPKSRQLRLNIQVVKKTAQDPQINLSQSNAKAQHAQNQLKDNDDTEACTPETNTEPPGPDLKTFAKDGNPPQTDQKALVTIPPVVTHSNQPGETQSGNVAVPVDTKWKPLKGMTPVQTVSAGSLDMKVNKAQQAESKTQGLKIEIKSKSRVRPGSLFDEVRKTARLNQRPRNQDSSSEEDPPPATGEQPVSHKHSRSKSRSVSSPRSRHRRRSHSYTSRSRSRSSSYSSRSYSRSRSRRRYSRDRSRSSSYHSYRSHTYSRSRSRSWSRSHRRSRSYTYDSYSSRSRSRSRRRRHRSRSSHSYSRSSSRRGSRSSRYS